MVVMVFQILLIRYEYINLINDPNDRILGNCLTVVMVIEEEDIVVGMVTPGTLDMVIVDVPITGGDGINGPGWLFCS